MDADRYQRAADVRVVDENYFKTMKIPVIAGRTFTEDDRKEGLQVAIDARKLIGQAQGILMERFDLTADQAFERVVNAIRPGVTEYDLATVIAGSPGDTVAVLVGSTSMASPNVPNPSIRPTSRTLQQGDVVMVELSKGGAGYAGQLHGMVSLGPATDRFAQAYPTSRYTNDALERMYLIESGNGTPVRRGWTPCTGPTWRLLVSLIG